MTPTMYLIRHTVCEPISFTVQRGDRVVLDGRNGSSKSSLLKLLIGEQIEHTGTVKLGPGLVISYVPQDTSHNYKDNGREKSLPLLVIL